MAGAGKRPRARGQRYRRLAVADGGRIVGISASLLKKAADCDTIVIDGVRRVDGYTYRLMLVDGKTYAPLCEADEIKDRYD